MRFLWFLAGMMFSVVLETLILLFFILGAAL